MTSATSITPHGLKLLTVPLILKFLLTPPLFFFFQNLCRQSRTLSAIAMSDCSGNMRKELPQ